MNALAKKALTDRFVLDAKELQESIDFFTDQINRRVKEKQKGISGAGLKSLSIDKAIDNLQKLDKRLAAALKTAEKRDFGEYMKLADWKEMNERQLKALARSQRKRVNVYEFSNEILEAIKDRTNIVEMVDELKIRKTRSGAGRYVIICPFHDEKTPSCMIYVNEDKFHCFGCQSHGDVVDFYQLYLNLEFDEAITRLCDRLSIQVVDADRVEQADEIIGLYQNALRDAEDRLIELKANYKKEIANANHN